MERTPEQVAADNRLEDAIEEAARAYGVIHDDEIVTAWVVVGAAQGRDNGKSGYFHMVPSGTQPSHISVGLLKMTELHLLTRGEGDD